MRKHWVVATVLTIGASALLTVFFLRVPLVPAQASKEGRQIDYLLTLQFIIGGAIFALVLVFLLYSVVVFRRRPGDMEDGPPIEGSRALEMVWTVVPLVIVLSLAAYGSVALRDMIGAPPGPELVVKVEARQFGWRFEYPQYGFTSPMLRLPVDQPVLLRITSRDVVHSFWVPEFRTKQDALPGRETRLRITPTLVGDYMVQCAELCGLAHWAMKAPVSVVTADDFQRWVTAQRR